MVANLVLYMSLKLCYSAYEYYASGGGYMYDQNDQGAQAPAPAPQPQDDNPYANLTPAAPTNNDNGFMGVNHDQNQDQPAQDNNFNNSVADDSSDLGGNTDDLLTIKQNVLKELNPLVQHLDQNPEEKFKTTMMMIQASDDQSLIKTAYETAKKIPNEKARAQALLDVVNEINYFTQQNNQ